MIEALRRVSTEGSHHEPPLLIGRPRLAAMLDISLASLDRLTVAKKTPEPVRLGGRVLWRVSDIDEWMRLGCPDRKRFDLLSAAHAQADRDRPR